MALKLTNEIYALIPTLIAEGKTRAEIAAMFGVKIGTLQVQCCKRGISLWGRDRAHKARKKKAEQAAIKFADDHLPKITEASQLAALRLQAKSRGVTEIGLITRLVEKVVERKLYDELLGKLPVAA